MKNPLTIAVAVIVVLVLAFYMVTYQVPFNQMAVVTTFGAADESAVINADDKGSGLHWKWPSPIQSVHEFSKGLQFFEDTPEQAQTKDKKLVVVNSYISWKINDPLKFYKTVRTTENAEKLLKDKLRAARSEIGKYDLADLTSKDPKALKLGEVENAIKNLLQSEVDGQGYGVTIVTAGIKHLIFPQSVSKQVNETMKSTRQRLAESARSEGEAIAQQITSDAARASSIILSFANQRAQAIRAEGDAAAAQYYPIYSKNSDLAIFLRTMESYKKIFSKGTTTFVLDAEDSVFELFKKSARNNLINSQTQDKTTGESK